MNSPSLFRRMVLGSDFRLTGRRLAIEVALTPWGVLAWTYTLKPYSYGNHEILPRYSMIYHFFAVMTITAAMSTLLGLIFGRSAVERLMLVGAGLAITLMLLAFLAVY